MKYYAFVNNGIEETAKIEIEEKGGSEIVVSSNVIEFQFDGKMELQSARRIVVSVSKFENVSSVSFKDDFSWKKYFTTETKFKIEVEGVKGQDNRISIAKDVAPKLFNVFEKESVKPQLEMRKPDLLIVVYFNGENYFIGVDTNIEEVNHRAYRVFPHQASFKGDVAYNIVRKTGYISGKKMVVGFCKDGVLAIEASMFSKEKIFAFDENRQNVTAARKNSKIAKVDIDVQRYDLDELDVKFSEKEIDIVLYYITTKDEEKLNEMYYQSNYILKKKGRLILLGREGWEFSVSDKFVLINENDIYRGDNGLKLWVLEKK